MIVRNGTLYGTTSSVDETRPQENYGTVFSITPSGHETVLHRFAGSPDGSYPEARLLYVNGAFYGTTTEGGSKGVGTVFSITPGGKEKVLYSFRGGTDGAFPAAGLSDVKGTLYGTTNGGGASSTNYYCSSAFGCGTVFSITPSGKEKVLHSFGNGTDGIEPQGGLVEVRGTLYGVTSAGGTCGRAGCGTVFTITPSGKEKVLFSFNGSDGSGPTATVLNANGTLYGTTNSGGAHGLGTVFSITLSGYETALYSFGGGEQDGAYPYSGLSYVNGTLYGTTSIGAAHNDGTVFSITP
jgi:uncharacterized repeat protein (TIGR03803 family)